MRSLQVIPVATKLMKLNSELSDFVVEAIGGSLQAGDVLAVTSKIVSLAEGCVVPVSSISKKQLISDESDQVLAELAHNCTLTLKHGLMMISAGIDESNSPDGDYILYPKDPWQSAMNLLNQLKSRLRLQNIGVILTDSHTIPMRRGVVGISLSHAGFRGAKDCVGDLDLFDRPLKFTYQDLADGLAAAAVLMMGEGGQSTPLAILRGADLEFLDGEDDSPLRLRPEEDLYFPFFSQYSRTTR